VVSVVIIAALAGAALYEHFARGKPAGAVVRIDLAVERAARRGDAYYVPFTVSNAGADAATDVAVRFAVKRGEEEVEESAAAIPFLPSHGEAGGEVVTAFDPATHEIEARVETLLRP
jgi:uncharacterized protein (TIGR02588 family)